MQGAFLCTIHYHLFYTLYKTQQTTVVSIKHSQALDKKQLNLYTCYMNGKQCT